MRKEKKIEMEKYGIKCISNCTYQYKQHKYENLEDAIRYAELDTKKEIIKDSPETIK